MEQAACMCTAEVCAHQNGEPCGKPVEMPVAYTRDGSEPERPIGLCKECWQRVEHLKKVKWPADAGEEHFGCFFY